MSATASSSAAPKALVAGGAGGIGRAIVRHLAEDGYEVTVADLPREGAEQIAAGAGAARFVGVDLAAEAGAQESVETAADGGPLHVLVNSQGISPKKDGRKRPFDEIDLSEWERVLAVNVTGPFLLARAAYPLLARDGRAALVNIVSITAKVAASGPDDAPFPPFTPAGAHYAASKAALANLTASLSRELAPEGIRCNGVSPGLVGTAMGGSIDEQTKARMVAQIPLGRPATPEHIATVVAFLCSERAAYITGEIVDVDGGWTTG
jgi:NAD(P)-dependent dehydrogenase (short-subunit alcohol dehydrogenase family)